MDDQKRRDAGMNVRRKVLGNAWVDKSIANRNAFAKWGDLYLEMVEPGIGEGNAREWLETRGEGIFHLGYATDDLAQRPDGAPVCFESFGATLANGDAAVRLHSGLHDVDALEHIADKHQQHARFARDGKVGA